MRPDLHMHSYRSDGVLSPELLAHEAHMAGVTLMAITDHDTFAGSDELRDMELPLMVLPGVELSLRDMNGLHLLGYGWRRNTPLHAAVTQLAEKRRQRAEEMLQKLNDLGLPLSMRELEKRCRGSVGRPHIARALVHAGYVGSMQEAFDRYIGHGKPAYVAGERLSMAESLPLMAASGFVPVLAHPYELQLELPAVEALVKGWQAQGLRGMEVYHPSARGHGYAELDRMARRLGLLVTGGSDFHQANDKHSHGRPGCTADDWPQAEGDVNALLQAMEALRAEV